VYYIRFLSIESYQNCFQDGIAKSPIYLLVFTFLILLMLFQSIGFAREGTIHERFVLELVTRFSSMAIFITLFKKRTDDLICYGILFLQRNGNTDRADIHVYIRIVRHPRKDMFYVMIFLVNNDDLMKFNPASLSSLQPVLYPLLDRRSLCMFCKGNGLAWNLYAVFLQDFASSTPASSATLSAPAFLICARPAQVEVLVELICHLLSPMN